MPSVHSMFLPADAGRAPRWAVRPADEHPSSFNPVLRGLAFAVIFEAVAGVGGYTAWLWVSHLLRT